MPGGLTARYVAVAAVYEVLVQVMPEDASIVAAPSVTVALMPEEQTPGVTDPLARSVKLCAVVPGFGVCVNWPLWFSATVPPVGAASSVAPKTLMSLAS